MFLRHLVQLYQNNSLTTSNVYDYFIVRLRSSDEKYCELNFECLYQKGLLTGAILNNLVNSIYLKEIGWAVRRLNEEDFLNDITLQAITDVSTLYPQQLALGFITLKFHNIRDEANLQFLKKHAQYAEYLASGIVILVEAKVKISTMMQTLLIAAKTKAVEMAFILSALDKAGIELTPYNHWMIMNNLSHLSTLSQAFYNLAGRGLNQSIFNFLMVNAAIADKLMYGILYSGTEIEDFTKELIDNSHYASNVTNCIYILRAANINIKPGYLETFKAHPACVADFTCFVSAFICPRLSFMTLITQDNIDKLFKHMPSIKNYDDIFPPHHH